MFHRPKLLIITNKAGYGHLSLAEALRDQFEHDFAIKIIKPYPDFFLAHYRFVSRHALWLWSAEYRMINTPVMSMLVHRMFSKLAANPLNMELDRFQPDVVITTHPFLTYGVKRILEKHPSNVPLVLFFSDSHLTPHWLSERNVAATFAPTSESYEQALNVGFDPNRLHLVGWPVRNQFYRTNESTRTETLTKLNLNLHRFTILLQGGGEGAAKIEQTLENVLAAGQDLQVILAAGTNQALLKRFRGVKKLYTLPFTQEVAPFMAAADVIMGKAGTNVIFESMTLGKPFIATTYIPGQEEGNLEFIQRHGLGWVELKPKGQRELITTLVTRSTQLIAIATKINAYRQWNCAANKSMIALIHNLVPATSVQPTPKV